MRHAQRKSRITTLLLSVFLIISWWLADRWYRAHAMHDARVGVQAELTDHATALSRLINDRIALLEGLAAFVKIHTGRPFREEFALFADGLQTSSKRVRSLAAVQEGGSRHVHPSGGPEGDAERNLIQGGRPEVAAAVQRAVRTGRIALSGPHELPEGDLVLVAWKAVYQSDPSGPANQLWGFVSLSLDLPPLLEEAGLVHHGHGVKVALRNARGELIRGSPSVFQSDPILHGVALPGAAWELGAEPIAGWDASIRSSLLIFRGFTLTILTLTVLSLHLVLTRHTSLAEAVAKRTETVSALNEDLHSQIAQRQHALAALRESEERLRQVVQNMPVMMEAFDVDGNILVWNRECERITGFSASEIVGNPRAMELLYPDPEYRGRMLSERKERANNYRDWAWRITCKDGSERTILWSDISGRFPIQGWQSWGIGVDITERRRLEEQLLQSQKMESVGQLAGGIAHDFNNILTAINGSAELAEMDLPPGDPSLKYVRQILAAAERGADLTRQLLAFARKQIIEPRVLDLNRLISNLEKMLIRLIGEHIELSTSLASDLWRVRVDPGQFEQVIVNLAVNARDAMPTGGKLIIETANASLDDEYLQRHLNVSTGLHVMVAVTDTGAGMDAEALSHVFEPFYTTKEPGRGTGLGLATCYGIVKQSGGYIWVYSEPGGGTTFKIYLPRVDAEADALEAREDALEAPSGTETILVVEDDPRVREMVEAMLRAQGYVVLVAAGGDEAIELAGEHAGELHLLLTDVIMPQMGGREVAERLSEIRTDLKVLYMSGYTENSIVHHGVVEEGLALIQKPFTRRTLAERVRSVLDETPS